MSFRDRYMADGFFVVPRLIDMAAVEALRAAYDELLEKRCAGDGMLGGIIRQIAAPATAHPVFADNEARRRGCEVAAAVLKRQVSVVFDQLVYKEPGNLHLTPWHQDSAYSVGPVAHENYVQFWIPLDDVDEDNGCMYFASGQHRGTMPVPHHVASEADDPNRRMLELTTPFWPPEAVVACPLQAGGATAHGPLTPHYTSGNRRAGPRRAYIMTCG